MDIDNIVRQVLDELKLNGVDISNSANIGSGAASAPTAYTVPNNASAGCGCSNSSWKSSSVYVLPDEAKASLGGRCLTGSWKSSSVYVKQDNSSSSDYCAANDSLPGLVEEFTRKARSNPSTVYVVADGTGSPMGMNRSFADSYPKASSVYTVPNDVAAAPRRSKYPWLND